jgi:hypothetical protein
MTYSINKRSVILHNYLYNENINTFLQLPARKGRGVYPLVRQYVKLTTHPKSFPNGRTKKAALHSLSFGEG